VAEDLIIMRPEFKPQYHQKKEGRKEEGRKNNSMLPKTLPRKFRRQLPGWERNFCKA
jgi:hypothetical protein